MSQATRAALLRDIFGEDVAHEGDRQLRLLRVLDQRRAVAAPMLAACVAAYEARFGYAVPFDLRRDLDSLKTSALALATLLIEQSANLRAFNDAFALLVDAVTRARGALPPGGGL